MAASKEATKLIGSILNWLVAEKSRIRRAMKTNAQWEIWLQVEMALFLQKSAGVVVREQMYDGSRNSLDILLKVGTRAFAIELKTESLKTGRVSGRSMVQALMLDKKKLQKHSLAKKVKAMKCNQLSSLVIGIGQSSKYKKISKQVLKQGMAFPAKIHGAFGVYGFLMET